MTYTFLLLPPCASGGRSTVAYDLRLVVRAAWRALRAICLEATMMRPVLGSCGDWKIRQAGERLYLDMVLIVGV